MLKGRINELSGVFQEEEAGDSQKCIGRNDAGVMLIAAGVPDQFAAVGLRAGDSRITASAASFPS